MATVVNQPSTPYFCTLNFQPGEQITISCTARKEAERLDIVFKCDEKPTSDIGLFLVIDFKTDELLISSKLPNGWGRLNQHFGLFVKHLPGVEIAIQCTHDMYKVFINGTEIEKYEHEIPWYNITHMAVCGEIDIKRITYLPVKQLIRTGGTPPPDYEMATRSDYGSLNIPITFKKEDEVLTMYPTFIPLVPVRSEIRESPENKEMSSNCTTLRASDTNNDIQSKSRQNFFIGTLIMTVVFFLGFSLFKSYYFFFNLDDDSDRSFTS